MYTPIILKYMTMLPQNSNKLVVNSDFILYYGDLQSSRIKVDREYPFKDDKGSYRLGACGGRLNKNYHNSDDKSKYVVDGNKIRQKTYKSDKDGTIPTDNIWYIPYGSTKYPTQKPYKLLERVICLGTK